MIKCIVFCRLHYSTLNISEAQLQNNNDKSSVYNPWPGYSFTGKLRPFPVVSRFVHTITVMAYFPISGLVKDIFIFKFCL